MRRLALTLGALLTILCTDRHDLAAQARIRWMAGAVGLVTTVDPVPEGGRLTEGRLVQPVVGGHGVLAGGALWWKAMVNLEGATIPSGALTPGAFGEGFVDRRHPHTYLHEAMLGFTARAGDWRLGGAVGKGFATFGSDDPMSRDPLRYPVNHHWAQVLERGVALVQIGRGPVMLEGSLMNGDEPERPWDFPNLDRFGDSWATRLSIHTAPGVSFHASRAHLRSPEHPEAQAHSQELTALGLRVEGSRPAAGPLLMVEWTRASEAGGAFVFHSLLIEGARQIPRQRLYYRFERTTRPEEDRLGAFRTARPPIDDNLLGVSRWTIYTLGHRVEAVRRGRLLIEPFVEGSLIQVSKVGEGVFSVRDYYAKDRQWSVSVGIRLGYGLEGHRMGRYGILITPEAGDAGGHH